jgi:serine/threonine protein phosphatase PrpC
VKDAPIADYGEVPFPPSAYFVMNSDGLTRVLSTTGLAEIVATHADDPEAAAERLICNANARGADDNVTVVIGMEGHDQRARGGSNSLRRAIIAGLLSAGPLLAPVTAGMAK